MTRTAIGLSFLVAVAVGSVGACSSSKTDEATGTAGTSSSGGSGGGSGGSSGTPGAAGSRAGSAGTAGAASGLCAGKMNMCLDDQTVQGCDPDTGMDVTLDCAADIPEGIENLGCGPTDTGSQACLIDFTDPVCWEGAQIFSVCAGVTTNAELFGFYLGCFNDMNGAMTVIPCYIPFADEATLTVDCVAADEACLPDLGAGGAGPGAGGAGGDPAAGGAP